MLVNNSNNNDPFSIRNLDIITRYLACLLIAISCFLMLPVDLTLADGGEEVAPAELVIEDDALNSGSGQASVVSDDDPQVGDHVIFLPIIIGGQGDDGATTPPTTPPVEGEEVRGVIGYFRSLDQVYDVALNGGVGGWQLSQNIWNEQPYKIRVGQLGEKWDGFPDKFEVNRGLIDFDTTSLTATPSEVYLHVKIIGKPADLVLPQIVHRGTWEGIAADRLMDQPEWYLWTAFDNTEVTCFLTTETQEISEDQPLEMYIQLPVDFIQPGDWTHLVIRSGEEGTEPPTGTDACTDCRRFVRYSEVDLIIVE
jgi:hypothetical protein